MSDKPRRTTLTLQDEILPRLDDLKRNQFYNDPKSKMFQYLIQLGLERAEQLQNNEAS